MWEVGLRMALAPLAMSFGWRSFSTPPYRDCAIYSESTVILYVLSCSLCQNSLPLTGVRAFPSDSAEELLDLGL